MLAALTVLSACIGGKASLDPTDTQSNDQDSAENDAAQLFDPLFTVTWTESSVGLLIQDGPPGHWEWGLSETHPDCGSQCWTGEDCLHGFGDVLYCHELDDEKRLLVYGGAPDTLQWSRETVFWSPKFEEAVTHLFYSTDTDQCWVAGHDPAYYADLGCTTAWTLDDL